LSTIFRLARPAVAVALGLSMLSTAPAGAISGGTEVSDGNYPFVAKLTVGEGKRACSGVLVHPQVVLTAAACFTGVTEAGEPTLPTTATVGRANSYTGTDGVVTAVTAVIAHPERDLALARLEKTVSGITPVSIAATVAKIGDSITFVGYGRTGSEWIPDRLQSARADLAQVTADVLQISGGTANICRGDAGGPVLRESGGSVQLLGLLHSSNQAGCLNEATGTPQFSATRVDDVTSWMSANLPGFSTGFETADPRPNWADKVNTAGGGGGRANVDGACCGLTGPETSIRQDGLARTGQNVLIYSGKDTSKDQSFAYMNVYSLTKMQVRPSTTLSYWIYPQSSTGLDYVSGDNSTCVAVDLTFTDGSNLRDSGAKDQHERSVHPAQQCGKLTKDTWNQVTVSLGKVAAGKQISNVNVGYDQAANIGGYRGLIDDLSITDTVSTAKFSTGLESGEPPLNWTDSVTPTLPSGGLRNVGGVCCSLTGPETGLREDGAARTGKNVLMYSGLDKEDATSYAYTRAFAPADVFVTPSTRLSYWIYPQSKKTNNNVSTDSSCAAVDLIFTDQITATKASLRDSGATDRRGNRAHPTQQCGKLTPDTWNLVSVPLGAVANGKQISQIDIGYDAPSGKGGYRGLIDDIEITQ
jgi:V8-like Glu-specific endopeptidase